MGRRRNRRSLAKRQPCGKIRQPKEEEREADVMSIAIASRQRHHLGLTPETAKKQEAGHAVGLALIRGELGDKDEAEARLAAAKIYAEVWAAYERSLLIKKPKSASDFNRMGGHDDSDGTDPDYVAKASAARRRMHESRRALLDADSFAMMAVNAAVLDDVEMTADSVLGRARNIGLSALARLYGVGERKAA